MKWYVPTCAALLTGITTPQMKATLEMTATAAVTWTAASLNLAMRLASVWSWPWKFQKSVTASNDVSMMWESLWMPREILLQEE